MTSKRAVIDPKRCIQCDPCPANKVCPASAIEREEDGEPYFINAFCQGCGKCLLFCPYQAIKIA